MQGLNTDKTIHSSRNSLILIGKTALSSFEGGRRAHILLNPETANRFRTFVDSIGQDSGVKSLYLFNQNGDILFNTKDIQPPTIAPSIAPHAIIETKNGLFFMYHTLTKPQRMMGGMRNQQRQPPGDV